MSPEPRVRTSGRSLGLNALLNLGGNVSYYAAVILVTPAAILSLGEEGWGIWQLAGAVANYALLLNLGLNSAIAYEVSRGAANSDLDGVGQSIHAARTYLVGVGLFLAAAFLVFGRTFLRPFVQESVVDVAYLTLSITGVITAATLPSRLFTSVLAGLQRFDLLASFRLASAALLALGALVAFPRGMGLFGFAALMSFAPALPGLLGYVAARRLLPRECMRWRRPDLGHLWSMLAYSVNTVLYVTGTVVLYQTLKFVASSRCGGPVAAGHMGLVINVVQILAVGFVPLAAVLQPRFADWSARGRSGELAALLQRALGDMGLLAVPAVTFLALEAPALFRAWIGSALTTEVMELLVVTLRWMLVGQGPYVLFLPCFYALLGMGEHRPFGIGMLCTGILTIVLSYVAASSVPSIHILGMVFGFALAGLVVAVTVPLAMRRFRLRLMELLARCVIRPTLVTSPGAIACFFRPRFDAALLDLAVAAVCFGAPTAIAIALARRGWRR